MHDAARRRWSNLSETPTIVTSSAPLIWRGFEFNVIEIPYSGTFDRGHNQFMLSRVSGPLKVRYGGSRRPFQDYPMHPQLALPVEGGHGAWLGAQRGMHLFFDANAFERMTHQEMRLDRLLLPNGPHPAIEHLLQAVLIDTLGGHLSGPALGEEIIASILNSISPGDRRGVPATRKRVYLGLSEVRTICDVIEAELPKSITLEQLATVTGLSVRHLCRAFRAAMGLSPYQYILRRRVDRAVSLMRDPELSLEEIAEAVGFASHAHMSTTFRRLLDATAAQIRRSRSL